MQSIKGGKINELLKPKERNPDIDKLLKLEEAIRERTDVEIGMILQSYGDAEDVKEKATNIVLIAGEI